MWETYICALVTNKHTLKHIHTLVQAQDHLKKAAKLLSTSFHYTDGIHKTLAEASEQQAKNFRFLKDNGLDKALTKYKMLPPPLKETHLPPGFTIKEHPGGLQSLMPITIKKPTLPPPNPQATAALAKTPTLTAINCLQMIEAAFTMTPVIVPTLAEYVMAPSMPTPTHIPTQTPSAFVPPTTILPVPPLQMNTAEFIDLVCCSISENATGISKVEQFATVFEPDRTNIPLLICSPGPSRGRRMTHWGQGLPPSFVQYQEPIHTIPSSSPHSVPSSSASSKKLSLTSLTTMIPDHPKPACYHCRANPGHTRKYCPIYHCHWCKCVTPEHHKNHCPENPCCKYDGTHSALEEDRYSIDDNLYGDGES